MADLENRNLTQGWSGPDISHLESTQHDSTTVNNTVIILGVLTFALQLCLVLFVLLRCWKLDGQIKAAFKSPDSVKKASAPSCIVHHICKQTRCQRVESDAASTHTLFTSDEPNSVTSYLFAPSIPWDLVQR